MLKLMRENAGSWIIKILLGIVVLVFIFLGIGPGRTNNDNVAAVVNKKTISMDEYRFTYHNMLQRYKGQFGENMSPELLKMLNLEQNTLESLIDREVLLQEAEKMGIDVTVEEVQNEIKGIGAFQENGQFSPGKYQNYIRYTNQSPSFFESMQREEMIIQKLRKLFGDTATVSEAEVKAFFIWEKMTAAIDYVLFKAADVKDVKPTDEDIKLHYEAHKNQYRSQPEAKVSFLRFSADDYKDAATVTDEGVAKYYEENRSRFETPKTVEARHILIKVAADATEEEVAEKELKARQVYDMAIKDDQDFAELAKTWSEGPTKDNGGYLGTFAEGKMVKPFSDQAFSMKEGDISEPVRTEFGWHVIKVEKVNPEVKRQLAEVKDEIVETLTREQAENKAYEEVDLVYDGIISGNTMEQSAEITGLPLVETDWFTQVAGPSKADAAIRRDIAKTAFAMSENGISDILELGGNYYIVKVTGKKDADVLPLEDVMDRVKRDLTRTLKDEQAKKSAEALIASIKDGTTTLDKTEGVTSTPTINRDSRGNDMGIDKSVVDAAFGLTMDNPLGSEPIKGNSGYYVIRLKEINKPDLALLDEEKDSIRSDLKSKKETQAFSTWLDQLKAQSEIERNSSIFNR